MELPRLCASYQEALRVALTHGAVTQGKAYAGGKSYRNHPQNWAKRDPRRELLFIHFFQKDGREVGYWTPNMNTYVTHSPPRVWAASFKLELDMKEI